MGRGPPPREAAAVRKHGPVTRATRTFLFPNAELPDKCSVDCHLTEESQKRVRNSNIGVFFLFSETTTRALHTIVARDVRRTEEHRLLLRGRRGESQRPRGEARRGRRGERYARDAARPGSGRAFPPIASLAAVDLGIRSTTVELTIPRSRPLPAQQSPRGRTGPPARPRTSRPPRRSPG